MESRLHQVPLRVSLFPWLWISVALGSGAACFITTLLEPSSDLIPGPIMVQLDWLGRVSFRTTFELGIALWQSM